MNRPLDWLTPDITHALGWTLLHFLWEGAALALLLYMIFAFTRNARLRYNTALAVLILMAVFPVLTFFVLHAQPATSPEVAKLANGWNVLNSLQAVTNTTGKLVGSDSSSHPIDWTAWFVSAWFTGVLVFGVRAFGGWVLVERLRREKTQALTSTLQRRCVWLQRRLNLSKKIRYLQSSLLDSPAVIGWFRPVVLLPVTALTGLSAEQLEAVIAHELAHIKRLDCFVNLFQIVVETVLFYHPAIWWVSRAIRCERENCCDDTAVRICGNAGVYARALTLIESWRATPELALAANGGSLKSRVSRLIGVQTLTHSVPRAGLAAAGLVCAAGALLASTTFNVTLSHASDSVVLSEPILDSAPPAVSSFNTQVAEKPKTINVPVRETVIAAARRQPRSQSEAAPSSPPPQAAQPAPAQAPSSGSYLDEIRSAGFTNITVDDLIALKAQNVNPEYIRQTRAAGLNPTVHELISMKAVGVTPDYIRTVRSTWSDATVHDLIAMRAQGIEPGDAAQFRQLGLKDMSLHSLISLRAVGVTPEYIHEMQSAGFSNLTAHEYVSAKAVGVTPEYVRALHAAGFANLTMHECISAKAQGITPEFIQKVNDHGFHNLTMRQLVALKNADVF